MKRKHLLMAALGILLTGESFAQNNVNEIVSAYRNICIDMTRYAFEYCNVPLVEDGLDSISLSSLSDSIETWAGRNTADSVMSFPLCSLSKFFNDFQDSNCVTLHDATQAMADSVFERLIVFMPDDSTLVTRRNEFHDIIANTYIESSAFVICNEPSLLQAYFRVIPNSIFARDSVCPLIDLKQPVAKSDTLSPVQPEPQTGNRTESSSKLLNLCKVLTLVSLSLLIVFVLYYLFFNIKIQNRWKKRSQTLNETVRNSMNMQPKHSESTFANKVTDNGLGSQVAGSIQKGEVAASFAYDDNEWTVVGASVIGNGHISMNLPCQDCCAHKNLGYGWGIAISSDGAGSAEKSQIGSKLVANRGLVHFEKLVKQKGWMDCAELPTDAEWLSCSYATIKTIRDEMAMFAEKQSIDLHSLNATIIVLIYSPTGILVAHVGDGRCCYRDVNGVWKQLIVPHKGEEANQTIFVTSDFWTIPNYVMSGVLVPESRVIREKPYGFALMSDGCESTTWLCNQLNPETGKYHDPNVPYDKFFNPVYDILQSMHTQNVPDVERKESWEEFIFTNGKFAKEQDDKTLIVGVKN